MPLLDDLLRRSFAVLQLGARVAKRSRCDGFEVGYRAAARRNKEKAGELREVEAGVPGVQRKANPSWTSEREPACRIRATKAES